MENGAAGRDTTHPIEYCTDVGAHARGEHDAPARARQAAKPQEARRRE